MAHLRPNQIWVLLSGATADNPSNFQFKNEIHACIWIRHEKYIQMISNKFDVGSVVYEIALELMENTLKFQLVHFKNVVSMKSVRREESIVELIK